MISKSIMKKYCIVSFFSICAVGSLLGQEYKLAKTTGKLVLNIPSAVIEGYDGKEIIFAAAG